MAKDTYVVLTNALLKFEIEAHAMSETTGDRGQIVEVSFYKLIPDQDHSGVTRECIASFYDAHAVWLKSEPVRLILEEED